jgi:hypothetical protein
MLRKLQSRLTYANVMSTIAVFGVLAGGVAFALERNEVKSRHIAPGEVKKSDTNDKLRLKCPGGTRYHEGACIETALRSTSASLPVAESDCFDDRRRLPTLGELENFGHEPGIALDTGDGEWTSQFFGTDSVTFDDFGDVDHSSPEFGRGYRCVARARR